VTSLCHRIATAIVSIILLSKASAQGSATDLTEALAFYARGEYARAFALLLPMAEQGNAVSQEIIGRMYSHGEGGSQDEAAAFKWYLEAAKQGRTDAQFEVGVMYRDGLGIRSDGQLAVQWFKAAAERGAPHAFNALGELHLGHPDVPLNPAAAVGWFLQGALLDHSISMYNLGLLYVLGLGVAQDDCEAYKWFELAFEAGVGEEQHKADIARTMVAQPLTNSEVWAAKVEVEVWLFKRGSLPPDRIPLAQKGKPIVPMEP
jgi:uncharacterized protein